MASANARRDRRANEETSRATEGLRRSPMMAHLLDALESGQDIGHYGRLVFTMVARHFLPDDEVVRLMADQPDLGEEQARVMLLQVKERYYNPPGRGRILEWQRRQAFPICPEAEADDPRGCSVYRDLTFPDGVYEEIEDYWEERADAQQAA